MNDIDGLAAQIRLTPADNLLQRGAFNEGHGHVEKTVDLAELVDGEQRRPRQPGATIGFTTKLRHAVRLSCQSRAEDFQSNNVESRPIPPRFPDISLRTVPQTLMSRKWPKRAPQ